MSEIEQNMVTNDTKNPEYALWLAMKDRCYNARNKRYYRYGGRGITVCNRWLESFDNFISDIGRRPSNEHSIDRTDNNGNYAPANVKWSTREEQCNNRRTNTYITIHGVTKSVSQWSRHYGVNKRTLAMRIQNGWSHERAITTPVEKRLWVRSPANRYSEETKKKIVRLRKDGLSFARIAKALGVSVMGAHRVCKGVANERSIGN